MIRAIEDLGFDSIWLGEHLLYRWPDRPPAARGRPGRRWRRIAAVTSRVEFGPLVACTNFHNPALLAKQAATIDEISGGRFILGLGAGWNETEFRAFGFPYDHRIDRFEEAFTIIRTLLQRWRDRLRRALLPGPRLRAAAARPASGGPAAAHRLERAADAADDDAVRRLVEHLVLEHRERAGRRRATAGRSSTTRAATSGATRRPSLERSRSWSGSRAGPGGSRATARTALPPLEGSPPEMADDAARLRRRRDRARPARARPDHARRRSGRSRAVLAELDRG